MTYPLIKHNDIEFEFNPETAPAILRQLKDQYKNLTVLEIMELVKAVGIPVAKIAVLGKTLKELMRDE